MKTLDCMIIGGGPAGLSASLTLGRARREIALFDDGTNRNRVTQESHGFITRDRIKPHEFKEIGVSELNAYPSVSYLNTRITELMKDSANEGFIARTSDNREFLSEKVILATGVQEIFPVPGVREFYGKSLFSCPYCDGWELRDKPLVIIADKEEVVLHMAKLIYNWSKDLVVLTNGAEISEEGAFLLQKRNIMIKTEPIKRLNGVDGRLNEIELSSGQTVARNYGFVAPTFYRPNTFAEQLGCEIHDNGAVVTDGMGRTTQKNIYIAGETEKSGPSSLMLSAADGSKAAFSVNVDLTMERF